MKTPESFEKAEICKYLDSIGAWYFKPMMTGYGKAGVSDIVGCWKSMFFSIEVKRYGKMPTAIQERRMTEVTTAGGKALWGTADRVIPLFKAWCAEIEDEALEFPWERMRN